VGRYLLTDIKRSEKKDIKTAKNEVEEALHDISKRLKPNLTGAIKYPVSALECVSRGIKESSENSSSIIKKNRLLFPLPL